MTTGGRLERVRALFEASLDRPPRERRAYLEAACTDDAALVQEVLDLLDIDEGNRSDPTSSGGCAMDWMAAGLVADAEDAELPEDPPPQSIGNYRVLREIGRGGMGIVYEAEQEEPRRRVAIKVMHPGLVGRHVLRRFRQETRVLGQLHHPGIAQVYEASSGANDGGRPYIVMELIDGLPLVSYAHTNHLDIRARLDVLAQVCDAVHHAHQKGVIHRDLKPSNILVAASEHGGAAGHRPQVLDFGVARLTEPDDAHHSRTEVGQIIGTVPYLSPEQAGGNPSVDVRGDIYSLGVVAFELLSGELPYDLVGRSPLSACRVIQEAAPRRLSAIRPELRGEIETIVRKALAKEPESRFQSAADLAADIRRFLNGEAIAAHPPSRLYRFRKFARRNKALVASVASSIGFLIAGTAVATTLALRASRSESRALWEQYRASMAAAAAALENDEVRAARQYMARLPPGLDGWERSHLLSRVEGGTVVDAGLQGPCWLAPGQSPGSVLVGSVRQGEFLKTVTTGQPGAHRDLDRRLWLSRSAVVNRAPRPLQSLPGELWTTVSANAHPIAVTLPPDLIPSVRQVLAPSANPRGQVTAFPLIDEEQGHRIVLIDAETRTSWTLPFGRYFPNRVGVSADGTRLAVACLRDREARIVDARSGAVTCTFPALNEEVCAFLFLENDTRLALTTWDGELELWDVTGATGVRIASVRDCTDAIHDLTASPDGAFLAGSSTDAIIRVWDARTLELTARLVGHDRAISGLVLLGSGAHPEVVSVDESGEMRRWNLETLHANPLVLKGHAAPVQSVAVAPRSRLVATAGWDRTAGIFSLDDGRLIRRISSDPDLFAVAFSPDESRLVTIGTPGAYRLFEVSSGREIAALPRERRVAMPPAFHEDGRHVFIDWPKDGDPMFWDTATNTVVRRDPDELLRVASPFICNQTRLFVRRAYVTGSLDSQTAHLVSIPEGRVRADLGTVSGAWTEHVAFSPDGRRLAAAQADHSILLYDLPKTRPIARLVGHSRPVLGLEWSADGERLFSAEYTGVIRVWDTDRHTEVLQLRGHTESARTLSLTPDGGLISASGDGTARIWNTHTDAQREEAAPFAVD